MSEAIPKPQEFKALLLRVWEETKEVTLGRIKMIEGATTILKQGLLTPELRAKAASEAHKLTGSLGMFGLSDEARLSREIETMLKMETDLNRDDGERLAKILHQLCCELATATQKLSIKQTQNEEVE
jgi:HPt (histidine-containing phosphotransfer) domain-containing protein